MDLLSEELLDPSPCDEEGMANGYGHQVQRPSPIGHFYGIVTHLVTVMIAKNVTNMNVNKVNECMSMHSAIYKELML